jgi:sugar lactone lactonase YvrE
MSIQTTKAPKMPEAAAGGAITRRAVLANMAAGVALAAGGPALAEDVRASRLALPDGFRYPNGIARDAGGTLYVGSVVSGQVLARGPDAATWRVLHAGSEDVFASTSLRLDEPRGILWGASPDFLGVRQPDGTTTRRPHRIYALDAATGAVRQVVLMPEGGFGNDLAVAPDGAVFVTDSALGQVLRLPPGASAVETVLVDERLRGPGATGLASVGAAGILLLPEGGLMVGNFGAGGLLRLSRSTGGAWSMSQVAPPGTFFNPDGMTLMRDGRVLLVAGDFANGDGRLLRLELDRALGRIVRVETLLDHLEAPVNVTTGGSDEAFLTESRLRYRFATGEQDRTPPADFWVTRVTGLAS